MSRPVEEINLDDFDVDDEYESTVGDTTGAVGGTPAETDFGGGQIKTSAEQSSVRRRGSVGWEDDITEEDIDDIKKLKDNSTEELARRLEDLRSIPDFDPNLLTDQLLQDDILEINTKLSTRWKEYVEKKLYHKFELEGGGTFKSGTKWSLTDKGIFVEYNGKKTQLTVAGNPRKFLKPSTISKKYGRGGTSFVRDILGVVDYSSASKKTQQQAIKTSWSLRDLPKLDETPTGRQDRQNRQDREKVRKKLVSLTPELDDFSNDLVNDPIADHEEISTFLTEQGQLKGLSDVFEHLVRRRDEKETELKNLKSKRDRTVSFVNPAYEGEEGEAGEALLPMSEEDADRARELEDEIKEFDTAITDQDAKVRNSIQRPRLSLENFIDSEDTLGSRVRELFRREGVTIASLLTAIGMTIAAVVEGIVLATKSAVSAVTPAPKPKPPAPKPPGPKPKPDVPDTPIEPPKPPEPPKPKTWTDWLKDQIQKIADLLLKLGDKALIALPGIIGTVFNFVLKSAGAVAGFLADHLWAFAVVVGGILYTSVMELSKKYTKKETKKKKVSKNRKVNKK